MSALFLITRTESCRTVSCGHQAPRPFSIILVILCGWYQPGKLRATRCICFSICWEQRIKLFPNCGTLELRGSTWARCQASCYGRFDKLADPMWKDSVVQEQRKCQLEHKSKADRRQRFSIHDANSFSFVFIHHTFLFSGFVGSKLTDDDVKAYQLDLSHLVNESMEAEWRVTWLIWWNMISKVRPNFDGRTSGEEWTRIDSKSIVLNKKKETVNALIWKARPFFQKKKKKRQDPINADSNRTVLVIDVMMVPLLNSHCLLLRNRLTKGVSFVCSTGDHQANRNDRNRCTRADDRHLRSD